MKRPWLYDDRSSRNKASSSSRPMRSWRHFHHNRGRGVSPGCLSIRCSSQVLGDAERRTRYDYPERFSMSLSICLSMPFYFCPISLYVSICEVHKHASHSQVQQGRLLFCAWSAVGKHTTAANARATTAVSRELSNTRTHSEADMNATPQDATTEEMRQAYRDRSDYFTAQVVIWIGSNFSLF